ncbi:MAG: carboxypeptidase-like regulatory domain-containing protein [Gemmatimonadales bacterium]|jgi:hypothetical protein
MTQRSTTSYRLPCALLLSSLAVLASPGGVAAQVDDTLATLRGQVLSRTLAEPIEQAFVFLLVNGKGGMTDADGRFSIKDVAPGVDTVQVRYFGFEPSTTEVDLQPGHITEATLLVSNTVLEVADLRVEVRRIYTGKLRGFEERRAKGFGDFITPQQIERRQPRIASDMLRGIAGVVVGSEQLGYTDVYFTKGSTAGRCYPTIWLDGQPMRDMNIDEITAADLLAIELYQGGTQMPPQWASNSCGLIIVWTKEGPLPEEG